MRSATVNSVGGKPSNGLPSALARACPWLNDPVLRQIQPKGLPLLYGGEDFEMGESAIHTITAGILFYGLACHFAPSPACRVFANLNLYYSADDPTRYVSPDVMVVQPIQTQALALPSDLASYRIGEQGPPPILVGEILSFRAWQQSDLQSKPILYSRLGVEEHIVVDVTGALLEQRLALLRPQADGSWRNEHDADGGVTSRLGFRLLIEEDGHLRVVDAKTGKRYARPDEAQAKADELATAVERIRALEKEVTRLRGDLPKDKKGKGRRRKS